MSFNLLFFLLPRRWQTFVFPGLSSLGVWAKESCLWTSPLPDFCFRNSELNAGIMLGEERGKKDPLEGVGAKAERTE